MNIHEIAVSDLQPGMFVSSLDRPWLETPYLIQGLLIQSQDDIEQLKQYCKSVYIDVDESEPFVAQYHTKTAQIIPEPDNNQPHNAKRSHTNTKPEDQQQIKKKIFSGHEKIQEILESKAPKTPFHGNKIYADECTVKEEMPVAIQAFDNVTTLLNEINIGIERKTKIDINSAQQVVDKLRDSVLRNPDAALLLARLKSTGQKLYDYAIKISVNLLALGRQLGLSHQELSLLGLGGLLMDVGKMSLPQEIQTKDSFLLNPSERKLVQQHVTHGELIMSRSRDIPDEIYKIVTQHHERENGQGYLHGLHTDQIHTYARMAAIVDCYEEFIMTGTSSMATKPFQVLKELKDNSVYGGLNTALVEQFIHCTGIFPVGSLVELNTGEVAIVLTHNRSQRFLPNVMIILDANKFPYETPITVDLRTADPGPTGIPYSIFSDLPMGAYKIDTNKYYL